MAYYRQVKDESTSIYEDTYLYKVHIEFICPYYYSICSYNIKFFLLVSFFSHKNYNSPHTSIASFYFKYIINDLYVTLYVTVVKLI